ncbi:unnamed protein product [Schistosoma mattheei]|uniref:Uncharacterized protein n=1 Tax=Schistosoma mattheei TaxID=31246 RepID=A0A183PWL7_9TREM|nr:unnamed protein product [Schistosoma mattheei]
MMVAKKKLKLKKQWTTGQIALKRFNTAYPPDTDKLNEFKTAGSQQQVSSLTRSTRRRNHYGEHLEENQ